MTRYEKMKPALDMLFSDLSIDEFANLASEALDGGCCTYCAIDHKYCDHMMCMDDPDYEEKYPFGNGVFCKDVIKKYLQEEITE